MKTSLKLLSRAAAIAGIGIIGACVSSTPAAAQQKVVTTTDLVPNIDEPGFNPYQRSQNILFTTVSGTLLFPIPANRVIVVEHVSLSGLVQSGGVVQAFLRCSLTSDASQEVNHSLVLFPQGEVNGF